MPANQREHHKDENRVYAYAEGPQIQRAMRFNQSIHQCRTIGLRRSAFELVFELVPLVSARAICQRVDLALHHCGHGGCNPERTACCLVVGVNVTVIGGGIPK